MDAQAMVLLISWCVNVSPNLQNQIADPGCSQMLVLIEQLCRQCSLLIFSQNQPIPNFSELKTFFYHLIQFNQHCRREHQSSSAWHRHLWCLFLWTRPCSWTSNFYIQSLLEWFYSAFSLISWRVNCQDSDYWEAFKSLGNSH